MVASSGALVVDLGPNGLALVVGITVLLAAAVIALDATGLLSPRQPGELPIMLAFGAFFLALGLVLCLGRESARIDVTAGRLVHTWGPGVTLVGHAIPLSRFRCVRLRLGSDDGSDTYVVELAGPDEATFRLHSLASLKEAHSLAASLARHLGWPVEGLPPAEQVGDS